ncbi:rhodanese-like domain-containing protein [Saccharothrix mutabilis subsp. mutabilis]|uniref:Rhodanese-like domain-containing protein n=1 Tax=Saccharothrix mutabilis subsp. mutabilis TaxID=66855 RepID=A0ABP3E9P8_9PSEU
MTRPTVDASSLRERLGDGPSAPRLIDVRSPAEFEAGHIPGAVNVPLDRLRDQLDDLCPLLRDQDVVLVCRSGQRAGRAQEVFTGAGLGHSTVLEGGIADWERAGGPLNRGRRVWDLERQVRFVAGSLVLAAVLASVVVPGAEWVAGFVGGGLVVAALTNTCAMGMALARMPWNRRRRGGPPAAGLPGDR